MFGENTSKQFDIVHPEMEAWVANDIVRFFKEQEGYENVPDFMIRDVFKTYFNFHDETKYKCTEMMSWWYEMLQNCNNYLLKAVTQGKRAHSFIAMKHIIKLLRDEIEKNEDFKNQCNNPDGGDGDGNSSGGGGGQQPPQPDLNDVNQNIQNKMDQAAQDAADEIDDKTEKNEQTGGGDMAGKGASEVELIEERAQMIESVRLNKKQVGTLIKKSIKGFKKGFGSKTILTEESLFEADTIEDLIDEHYLFDEVLAFDVAVRDSRQQMTAFDLYIDVSGSMNGGLNVNGKNVNRLQLAIAMAARMNQMGCLGEVYAFNNSVRKIGVNGIWHLRTGGGTTTENCLKRIKKNGRPSVILTDGCDSYETYTENAFIMTIAVGTGWSGGEVYEKMVKSGRYIQYDGKNLIKPKKR
jgi:hypothetical protein